jgi:hypothetical protein
VTPRPWVRAALPLCETAGRLRRLATAGVAALLLASCTNMLAARQARLQQLVGRPLDVLIATEGVPDQSFQEDGVTYLGYVEQHIDLAPPLPIGGPPLIWGPYAALPRVAVIRACETIFAVKGGIVQGFTLRGNACG